MAIRTSGPPSERRGLIEEFPLERAHPGLRWKRGLLLESTAEAEVGRAAVADIDRDTAA
jgi:hypothetical protein